MTRRRESLLLLLGSLNDHLPALGVNFRPTHGLVAAEKRPCPACGHTQDPGWRVDGFKRRTPCQVCGGKQEPSGRSGFISRDGGSGTVRVDPMDVEAAPVRTLEQAAPPTKAPRVVSCDSCDGAGVHGNGRRCAHCDGSGKRPVVSLAPLGASVERGREWFEIRDDAGHYHDLERALTAVGRTGRSLILAVHGPAPWRLETDLTMAEYGALQLVLTQVEAGMPERIRVPGYVRAAAKRREESLRKIKYRGVGAPAIAARDKEIRRLIRQGKGRQWVAGQFGLSVAHVYRIAPQREVAA